MKKTHKFYKIITNSTTCSDTKNIDANIGANFRRKERRSIYYT